MEKSLSKKKHVLTAEDREKARQALLGTTQSPERIEQRRLKNLGQKRSPETKEKMRIAWQARKAIPVSEETREKIRQAVLGTKKGPPSEATRTAISAAKKGKPASPAMQAAAAQLRGVPTGRTPWNKGKKLPPLSVDHRAKIGAKSQGHTLSAEARAKISAARVGRPFPDEHKQALSEAALARWERGNVQAFRSQLEIRIGGLLEPLGFEPQFHINGSRHPYDYGHLARKVLIEVNGCFWHAHGCGVRATAEDVSTRDQQHRDVAETHGYRLIILWQCEEAQWPAILQREGVL